MNESDTRRYEMLVRVRDFGASHADRFPKATVGGQAFAAVIDAVAALSEHASSQVSAKASARQGTTSKTLNRRELRARMEAISRTARALALDVPALDETFKMPRSLADQVLLSTARAFARDAQPLSKQFVSHDLPKTFITDLERCIDQFEVSMHNQREGNDTHAAARVAIRTAMDAGFAAVRRLEAIVPNKVGDDAEAIALWERAHRVERRGPRSPRDAAPSTTPVATTAAPASA